MAIADSEMAMTKRLLKEMPLPRDLVEREAGRGTVRRGGRRKPAARTVTVNLAESPLGWLKSRGLVTARQFDAGETLRADWERGQLSPSVTMRWDAAPSGIGPGPLDHADLTGAQVAARCRFHAAVAAVGRGLGDILWRTVCAGEGMREAEQALGWPARSGRLVLALALDRLADHYRMR
jgi:hypothetical protein